VKAHRHQADTRVVGGKPYQLSSFLWRQSPGWVRAFVSQNQLARKAKTSGQHFLAQFAGRDDVYNRDYYSYVDNEAARSAPAMVESIVKHFSPLRIVDLGCGTGALLAKFHSRGLQGVGLEYSQAGLDVCKQRGLTAHRFNIESHEQMDYGVFDVAVCFEVAEHISAEHADRLVDFLVRCAPRVVFTAATPGQGGADHVNEQRHEYWITKFAQRKYRLLRETSEQWRREWQSNNVAAFYSKNLMIYENSSTVAD
jgi:SAM-dependent methyltransferase